MSEARRQRQLDEENRRLKQMVANQALDLEVLRTVLEKSSHVGGAARFGYRRLTVLLRREGRTVNSKRVSRYIGRRAGRAAAEAQADQSRGTSAADDAHATLRALVYAFRLRRAERRAEVSELEHSG